jgi:hypothetical protein
MDKPSKIGGLEMDLPLVSFTDENLTKLKKRMYNIAFLLIFIALLKHPIDTKPISL